MHFETEGVPIFFVGFPLDILERIESKKTDIYGLWNR